MGFDAHQRWYQFRLWHLLLLTTLFALTCSAFAVEAFLGLLVLMIFSVAGYVWMLFRIHRGPSEFWLTLVFLVVLALEVVWLSFLP